VKSYDPPARIDPTGHSGLAYFLLTFSGVPDTSIDPHHHRPVRASHLRPGATVGRAAALGVSEVDAPVFVRYSIPVEAECQRVAA
jgi:hypothetical protein